MNSHLKSIVLLCVITVTLGCSGKNRPEGLPDLIATEVKITQEGTPVSGAFVRLVPESASNKWSSGGTTDANGVAVIRVDGEYVGAPAGEYKVVVSKTIMEGPKSTGSDLNNLDAAPTKSSSSVDLIDPMYANPSKTTLNLSVSQGQKQFEFDVGAAVHRTQNAR